jgi:hypothetical protein
MGAVMSTKPRLIYRSSNGDRWFLRYDPEAGRAFVKHEANIPSGGQVTEFEIDAFLSGKRGSPERQALVRLIGTLVEDNPDA